MSGSDWVALPSSRLAIGRRGPSRVGALCQVVTVDWQVWPGHRAR